MTNKFPYSKMQSRLKAGKFDEWQQESFRIASTEVYPASLKRFETPSESYKRKAFEVAQEQITLAGYRLGEMLNQIFGSQEITREQYEKEKLEFLKQYKFSGSKIGQGDTDGWLWVKVRSALASTSDLRDSTINVSVENAVITLTGTIAHKNQEINAVEIVNKIEGVKVVKDMLKIKPNDSLKKQFLRY